MKLFRLLPIVPIVALFMGLNTPVVAQNSPVVIELYTSQGCSSCPPADALLHKLAQRDDVIPLALHVDYWDYIGWKDIFADPEHAQRQRRYARVAGRRSVYTPQMIVNGVDSIVGARGMEISEAISNHKDHDTGVRLQVSRTHDGISIEASAPNNPGPMVVHVVRYAESKDVKITRGENAGRSMSYSNVVEDWRVLTEWSGRRDLSVNTDIDGDGPVVVLIQSANQGPMQAAAQLR
ncbi:MAG: DUF1223 domain-containing protein [Aliishimia sp.]